MSLCVRSEGAAAAGPRRCANSGGDARASERLPGASCTRRDVLCRICVQRRHLFLRGLKLHCLPLCSPEADTENPDAVRNHWSLPLREFETKSIFERTSPTAEASRTLRGPGRFLSKVWATWFSTKRTGCWIWAPCLQLEHRSFQKPEEL